MKKITLLTIAILILLSNIIAQSESIRSKVETITFNYEDSEVFEYGSIRIQRGEFLDLHNKTDLINLLGINSSLCNIKINPLMLSERIISKKTDGDTTIIEVGFPEVCCVSFIGDLSIKKDTLDLLFYTRGESCECYCCYTLEYKFINITPVNHFKLNGKPIKLTNDLFKTYPETYKIINCDTINHYDRFRFKQGVFVIESKDSTVINYKDNFPVEYSIFYPNGKLKIHIRNTMINWDNSGWMRTYVKERVVKYWDKEGEIIDVFKMTN